jgi:hypothetical protein
VLGPPRDPSKIDDLDPIGDENFGGSGAHGLGAAASAVSSLSASPFPRRHVIPLDDAFKHPVFGNFYRTHYGNSPDGDGTADGKEVPTDALWRRMNQDSAADADALALAMNNATNNSSLVLAFEVSKGGKVLLFAGDAQAGNWRSWSDQDFEDGAERITTKDILGRTVLYKVGHHGSHNATLNGKADAEHACLAWMAKGRYSADFVAMITAVEKWAHQKPKPDWNHPLPAIKQALLDKAAGRVLQTDSPAPSKPARGSTVGWQTFVDRVAETPLYFDLRIDP